MLQSILQNLIPTMQNMAMAMIPLAMLLALANKEQQGTIKKWIWRGIVWGLIGAAFIATAKLGSRAVKREVFEGMVLVAGLIGETLLMGLCLWNLKRGIFLGKEKILGRVICLVVATLLLYHGLDAILFPVNLVVSANDPASVELLLQIIGYLLGLILIWLTGWAVFQAARVLLPQRILLLLILQFIVIMGKQTVVVIQIMMARKLLAVKGLMSIMGPVINQQVWFLYLLLAITLLLPVALFLQGKPLKEEGLNPAQYRKILITSRKKKRWGAAVTVSLLVIFLCASVGKGYADEKAEIVPAVPVMAVQGMVLLPLDKVSDGHLHRFSYQSSTGEIIRFIVIKKSGSAYGVGFDACEICGATGYFERDNQVVCALCDVVMNTATIGFKGGCNPIPIEYKVAEGKIMLTVASLEKEKKRFK